VVPMPMRPRWADIRDSSNDDSFAEPLFQPPLATDSYREPPEASLENSRIGLNQWLRCASELKEAPTDFAFLLAGAGTGAATAGESLSENPVPEEPEPKVPARGRAGRRGARGGAGRGSARAARPSAASSVSGASGGSKEPEAHEAAAAAPAAAPASQAAAGSAMDAATESDEALDAALAHVDFLFGNETEADGDTSETGTGTASLKRTGQPGAQAPAGKRPRGGSDGSAPLRRLPEASEGTWQRRAEKRQLSVTAGKATPEYAAYTAAIPQEHRTSENPRTPDPMDRTVSKRQWDEGVRLWRLALRQWAGANTV